MQENLRGQNSETKAGKRAEKSTGNGLRKKNREKHETGLFSGSFYGIFLQDIPGICIFIQEKQVV